MRISQQQIIQLRNLVTLHMFILIYLFKIFNMKTLLFLLSFLFLSNISFSQNDTIAVQDTNTYRFIKLDGGELIGKILSQDAREVLIVTSDNRKIYVPQHTIKEMVIVNTSDFNNKGDFIGEDKFATRYFITTNGLPIKKGEHYVQWNLFGPDFQFGLGDNLGVGIMTSWLGIPIIGTIKKSWELGEKTQFALGGLIGFGSWAAPRFGGALPFATLSFGSRKSNIAFSGGYGAVWFDGFVNGQAITSVAGMTKVSPKISLVFDSFILMPSGNGNGFALLIPGVRWHQSEGRSIQFGFTGVIADGDLIPIPIPMVQWYRSL